MDRESSLLIGMTVIEYESGKALTIKDCGIYEIELDSGETVEDYMFELVCNCGCEGEVQVRIEQFLVGYTLGSEVDPYGGLEEGDPERELIEEINGKPKRKYH